MNFSYPNSKEQKALKNAYKRLFPFLIVGLIISSLIISYQHFLHEQETIFDIQQKLITDTAIDYNNSISNLASIIRAMEDDYTEFATRNYTKDAIENYLIDDMSLYPMIDQVRVLDLYGKETIRINKGNPVPYAIPEHELQDKSDQYYYKEVRLLGKHQFLFSAIDLNMEHGVIEIDPDTGLAKPTLRIITPIVLEEHRIGYFIVNFLMRDFLSDLRNSSNIPGGYTILFDQNGYMLNHENDAYNFRFGYDEEGKEQERTVTTLFPHIDLNQEAGTFVGDDKIGSYAAYNNIGDLSNDYFLSSKASEKLYLLVFFDVHSPYGEHIKYSPVTCIIDSWKAQMIMLVVVIAVYFLLIFLFFQINRSRFTNTFADNRYRKTFLKKALENHEFINYYQPIIDIQNGTLIGVEALSRWKTGDTVLAPNMFLSEIHNYELFTELDENTFRNVREDRQRLEELGLLDGFNIFINISNQTFEHLIKRNTSSIKRLTAEEKKYMVFELLEDIVFNNDLAAKIQDIYDQNVQFAIDDFGTGNSNIAFIRRFKNMRIKIDKAFVPNRMQDKEECLIIETFVQMFLAQGFKVIVEGVETKEQYIYLKKLKVPGVQGYYFSKPLSFDQLIVYIRNKEYLKKIEDSR